MVIISHFAKWVGPNTYFKMPVQVPIEIEVSETLTCCMKCENLPVPLLGKKNRSYALFLEIVHQISLDDKH